MDDKPPKTLSKTIPKNKSEKKYCQLLHVLSSGPPQIILNTSGSKNFDYCSPDKDMEKINCYTVFIGKKIFFKHIHEEILEPWPCLGNTNQRPLLPH